MKKRTSLAFLLILSAWAACFAQIKIKTAIYKANFSNSYHQPKYVSYYLYKGGGDCNRKNFEFSCDGANVECAIDADYKGSGYDKGHLANAEDFAFDCTKDELTFRYYNCLPQTPNLNRGIWETKEALIRQWSQKEKLYIICGGVFGDKKIGSAAVPNYCWKVVQSVKTKEVLFCGWFTNNNKATLEEITVAELARRLKTNIILL